MGPEQGVQVPLSTCSSTPFSMGPETSSFFGPQMALAYRLDAISQGDRAQKTLEIQDAKMNATQWNVQTINQDIWNNKKETTVRYHARTIHMLRQLLRPEMIDQRCELSKKLVELYVHD